MSFLGEIRRRKIVQVAATYAVVAWLLVQIVVSIEAPLRLPPWTDTLVIVLLALGFPITLMLSWAFNLTPEGVVRDRGQAPARSGGSRRIEYALAALLLVAAVWIANRELGLVEIGVDATLPNSIAVLPFENLSPDEADTYFADGLHEEILNRLAHVGALNVIARTSVMRFKGTSLPLAEVARQMNVTTVMEGSVRYSGNRIRVTAQLIDPATEAHLWSETYDREFSDAFAIESDIAMNVANALLAEFSLEEQARIEQAPTQSRLAHELYLAALAEFSGPGGGGFASSTRALELIEAVLAEDPGYVDAWLLKSRAHGALSHVVESERIAAEQQAALDAAERAVALDSRLPEAHGWLALARLEFSDWIGAMQAQRTADALARNSPGDSANPIILDLASGRFRAAQRASETLVAKDPLNGMTRGLHILALGLSGDGSAAIEEHARGTRLLGDPWIGNWFVSLLRLGTGEPLSADDVPPVNGAVHNEMRAYLNAPRDGLARLHELFETTDDYADADLVRYAVWAAYFGDTEFALDVLERLLRDAAGWTHVVWTPAMREVRQQARFRDLLREIGIVELWNEFGWPEICRPLDDGDFACS